MKTLTLRSLGRSLQAEGRGLRSAPCTQHRCCTRAGKSSCHHHQGLFLADTVSEHPSPSQSSRSHDWHSHRCQSLEGSSRTGGKYLESLSTHRCLADRRSPPHTCGQTWSGLKSQEDSSSQLDSQPAPWLQIQACKHGHLCKESRSRRLPLLLARRFFQEGTPDTLKGPWPHARS